VVSLTDNAVETCYGFPVFSLDDKIKSSTNGVRLRRKSIQDRVVAIPLITKIRIVALIIAAFLLVGGFKAALHPKLRIAAVVTEKSQTESQPRLTYPVELVTSQGSRVFGIVRVIIGAGLALYVWAPWLGIKNSLNMKEEQYDQKSE
jgi:hypothetical protein